MSMSMSHGPGAGRLLSPDADTGGGGAGEPIDASAGEALQELRAAGREEIAEAETVDVPEDEEFDIPSLDELVGESDVAQQLRAKDLEEAIEIAEGLGEVDAIEVMNFGLDDQEAASRNTEDFIDQVRVTDLEGIGKIATESNQLMEQLNFGDLKPSAFKALVRKLMPGSSAKVIDRFMDQHKRLSDVLNERNQAYAEEKLKLEEDRKRAAAKIQENVGIHRSLSRKIAALQLAYAQKAKQVEAFKEAFKKRAKEERDPETLRTMEEMDKVLTLQSRRITSLKAGRTETNNATRTMQEQVDAIDIQIQNINDQQHFNRLVWSNTALMMMIDRKTKDSVKAVKYTRETLERLLNQRAEGIAETVEEILKEAKAGVVDVSVLEAVTRKNIEMNAARLKGYKGIRDRMQETGAIMERLERELDQARRFAAASTEEEIAEIDEQLERVRREYPDTNTSKDGAAT